MSNIVHIQMSIPHMLQQCPQCTLCSMCRMHCTYVYANRHTHVPYTCTYAYQCTHTHTLDTQAFVVDSELYITKMCSRRIGSIVISSETYATQHIQAQQHNHRFTCGLPVYGQCSSTIKMINVYVYICHCVCAYMYDAYMRTYTYDYCIARARAAHM